MAIEYVPQFVNSVVGKVFLYVMAVFFYYGFWLIASMFILNPNAKYVFLHLPDNTVAKYNVRLVLLLLLLVGIYLTMLALGIFSDPKSEFILLSLYGLLFTAIIIKMLEIMIDTRVGGEEFYNTIFSFIITVGVLSPAKTLVSINATEQIYFALGLLFALLLLSLKSVGKLFGSINKHLTKQLIKEKQKEVIE